jgi:opacity protein-like surface antigen
VDIGPISIGGRATYYDPKDASSKWCGGAQVRLYPSRHFAIEDSADYRRNDFGDTRVHSYPVQVSALIYPLGTTRLAPFILGGGGWYYTTVKGPGGFDDTHNRFGLHAGGGLQFFLNQHWSIDSQARGTGLANERQPGDTQMRVGVMPVCHGSFPTPGCFGLRRIHRRLCLGDSAT